MFHLEKRKLKTHKVIVFRYWKGNQVKRDFFAFLLGIQKTMGKKGTEPKKYKKEISNDQLICK